MKAYGSGCIDPHFLDLGTSLRLVVNFTPRPLYPRDPLDIRIPRHGPHKNTVFCCQGVYCSVTEQWIPFYCWEHNFGHVFTQPLPSNWHVRHNMMQLKTKATVDKFRTKTKAETWYPSHIKTHWQTPVDEQTWRKLESKDDNALRRSSTFMTRSGANKTFLGMSLQQRNISLWKA
jgi:hypothetical protein